MQETKLCPVKVLIVDDHQMFLDGLKLVLRKAGNIKIVAQALTGIEALEIISNNNIDLVVTDIHMPEMSGLELTKIIKKDYHQIKVLVVTSFSDIEIIKQIFDSEAEGYILKNAGKHELIEAIDKICAGGIYYSNEVTSLMMRNIKNEEKLEEQINCLTQRELEILKLIYQEYSNNDIAAKLEISHLTVETHRKHIFRKTNSKTIVGLIKFAIENNLI
ncbi:MAG: response regulator transcription factor [Bacteroidetes bacterium]|nr:response regulator transcription factor [Bacteroidota bacterium]